MSKIKLRDCLNPKQLATLAGLEARLITTTNPKGEHISRGECSVILYSLAHQRGTEKALEELLYAEIRAGAELEGEP